MTVDPTLVSDPILFQSAQFTSPTFSLKMVFHKNLDFAQALSVMDRSSRTYNPASEFLVTKVDHGALHNIVEEHVSNYGVICEDEAKRRNSGAKTKTFKENSYLLPYVVSSKEDTVYQRQFITSIRVRLIPDSAYHSSSIRRISSWSSVKDLQLM
ncbi:hypothetical protein Tco_0634030 [Tanacetum coccineum]